MAFRQFSAGRTVLSTITGLAMTASIITPVHAEEPPHWSSKAKKPIYDLQPPTPSPASAPNSPSNSEIPTPTDRLANEIRKARLFLHAHTVALNDTLDRAFSKYLSYESSVTSTIADLSPPKSSSERVLPGVLYVAVSTMASSILCRRRMLPIRFVTPVAVAVGAGWYFLPETSRNVGNLVWEYERMVPGVAEGHLEVRKRIDDGWEVVDKNVKVGRKALDDGVRRGRGFVEEWVKKG